MLLQILGPFDQFEPVDQFPVHLDSGGLGRVELQPTFGEPLQELEEVAVSSTETFEDEDDVVDDLIFHVGSGVALFNLVVGVNLEVLSRQELDGLLFGVFLYLEDLSEHLLPHLAEPRLLLRE